MAVGDRWSAILCRRLEVHGTLSDEDRQAIAALPIVLRTFTPNAYILRDRQQPVRCGFIVEGFAFRQKLAANGGRQILGVLMPGDFTDLQQLYLSQSDHNIQALTRLELAEVPSRALRALVLHSPAIARACWVETLIGGSIIRELALNLGRRDAITRLSHLFSEFETRLDHAGLGEAGLGLPMTQEQLGDATGLTAVHVNRTLKQLEREGLISRRGRFAKVEDRQGLAQRGDFDPLYLHFEPVAMAD